jgi:uncharacterized protein involved in type VI secretion and phage assembly
MSSSTATTAGRRTRPAGLTGHCRAWFADIADRAHARGDVQARAAGWTVTVTPGRLGLSGRAYRDPRFGPQAAVVAQPEGSQ